MCTTTGDAHRCGAAIFSDASLSAAVVRHIQ